MVSQKSNSKKELLIGIQGGPGSFNEQAIREYTRTHGVKKYRLVYLYTTGRVLKALHTKKIDRGMFAIQNTIGGMVWETINALSRFNCRILEDFQMNISHCLFVRPGTKLSEIKTIMSHPQALAQCERTLKRRFPGKKTIVGKGILVDQATAAKHLSQGKLSNGTAVLASRAAGEAFGLKALATGLRDKKLNFTTFLFVARWNGDHGVSADTF